MVTLTSITCLKPRYNYLMVPDLRQCVPRVSLAMVSDRLVHKRRLTFVSSVVVRLERASCLFSSIPDLCPIDRYRRPKSSACRLTIVSHSTVASA